MSNKDSENNYLFNTSDLLEIFSTNLKRGLIISSVILFITIIVLFFVDNIYESETRLSKNILLNEFSLENSNGLAGSGGSGSSLLNIISSGSTDNVTFDKLAIEYLESEDFIFKMLSELNLAEEVAATNSYNSRTNKIKYKNFVDRKTELFKPELLNDQERLKYIVSSEFIDNFEVIHFGSSPFYSFKYKHKSPEVARLVLHNVVSYLNSEMQKKELERSSNVISELQKEMITQSSLSVTSTLSLLLERELKRTVLIRSNEDFVFVTISKASLPQFHAFPNRIIISIFVFIACLLIFYISKFVSHFNRQD